MSLLEKLTPTQLPETITTLPETDAPSHEAAGYREYWLERVDLEEEDQQPTWDRVKEKTAARVNAMTEVMQVDYELGRVGLSENTYRWYRLLGSTNSLEGAAGDLLLALKSGGRDLLQSGSEPTDRGYAALGDIAHDLTLLQLRRGYRLEEDGVNQTAAVAAGLYEAAIEATDVDEHEQRAQSAIRDLEFAAIHAAWPNQAGLEQNCKVSGLRDAREDYRAAQLATIRDSRRHIADWLEFETSARDRSHQMSPSSRQRKKLEEYIDRDASRFVGIAFERFAVDAYRFMLSRDKLQPDATLRQALLREQHPRLEPWKLRKLVPNTSIDVVQDYYDYSTHVETSFLQLKVGQRPGYDERGYLTEEIELHTGFRKSVTLALGLGAEELESDKTLIHAMDDTYQLLEEDLARTCRTELRVDELDRLERMLGLAAVLQAA